MNHPLGRAISVTCLALLFSTPTLAQGPSASWQTLSTPHYRFHFPEEYEGWARSAAQRMESIRERVSQEIGWIPEQVVDVLVINPRAQSNGMALPVLSAPRMILWTNPPPPSSVIGYYSSWSELLLVHEDAHLVHLLRPSRNGWQKKLSRVLPISPLARRSPRWVTEGYATVVEGRLTGSGRPASDFRAAVLRRRAQQGQLPTYGQLSADRSSWLGMSMAYLAGSAYLEWLEERAGPGSLRNLWARMTAKNDRGFDAAFAGVFGDSPKKLYGRFTAELTYQAMELERRQGPGPEGDELWQDLKWATGQPTLSPDGEKIALVLRHREDPPELVVWSTGSDEEAAKKRAEAIEKILESDPDDVLAVQTKPPARKKLFTLPTINGARPSTPRFLADGKSILYVRFEPDQQGFFHPDLYRWTPEEGRNERLTRFADLREPDPSPTGDWAVAVRNQFGYSQLVKVSLAASGKRGKETGIEPITEPSLETVWAQPRVSPDGSTVVAVRHQESSWKLIVIDLASGRQTTVVTPEAATLSYPAWSGEKIVATVGTGGYLDLWSLAADGSTAGTPLTRAAGGALAPAPAANGEAIYYLGLEADGLDLRRLALNSGEESTQLAAAPAPEELEEVSEFVPAVPRSLDATEPYAVTELPAASPYGLGKAEFFPLIGGQITRSFSHYELGVRVGDVVGRYDLMAIGALSSQGDRQGAAVAGSYRGWPVEVQARLYSLSEEPSKQKDATDPLRLGRLVDAQRQGLEVGASWQTQTRASRLELGASFLIEEVDLERPILPSDGSFDRQVASLSAGYQTSYRQGDLALRGGADLRFDEGESDDSSWSRVDGTAKFGVALGSKVFQVAWRRGSVSGTPSSFDVFRLGGTSDSLLPRSEVAARIFSPALPDSTLLGEEMETQRGEFELGGSLPTFFYQRFRLWPDGADKGDWLELAGAEWAVSLDHNSLMRLPGVSLNLGAGWLLEAPFDEELRGWATITWEP